MIKWIWKRSTRDVLKVLAFIIIIGCINSEVVTAQKKKGGKKGASGEISAAKLREAEYIFTEGQKYFILEDYAKALGAFQKSLEVFPGNATAYYKIADIYARSNDNVKAIDNITKALELDSANKYFYILAAQLHTRQANFSKASELYEEMIGKIKGTEEYLFELAAQYLFQNRLDDALNAYERAETKFGISEQISLQKQKIFIEQDKFDDAVKEGEKLIEAFPWEEAYVVTLAELFISNNMSKEAVPYLEKSLQLSPENAQARLILSEIYRKQGDRTEAARNLKVLFDDPEVNADIKIQLVAEYRAQFPNSELEELTADLGARLTKAHPENADAQAVYGDVLNAMNNKEDAKDAYLKSLKADNSNFSVWQNVLQLELELGLNSDVVRHSEEALELFPNQGSLFYYNGVANLQQKNYQEAVFALERGKKLSSSNLELLGLFYSLLGDAYHGNKQYAKAYEAYDAALDVNPNNYGVLNNYSYYLALRKEKLEEAEKMAERVVKDNPNNNTYLDTYAWVLYARKKYKEAKKVMEKVIKSDQSTAVYFDHYGDILFKLGQIDAAVENWEKARSLNANLKLIDKKIADRKLYE
ncbi:MAG: tetratricopeptide repeat protein [Bacteroidota bacterium]